MRKRTGDNSTPYGLSLVGKIGALLVILALAAGCGKPRDASISLKGETPTFGAKKYRDSDGHIPDPRKIEYKCPSCGKEVPFKIQRCKRCERDIAWPKSIFCSFCNGLGRCPACLTTENGKCRSCKGEKFTEYGGDCANCKGSGTCPICHGSAKCDACEGTGRIELQKIEDVRQRLLTTPFIGDGSPDKKAKEEGKEDGGGDGAEKKETPDPEKEKKEGGEERKE